MSSIERVLKETLSLARVYQRGRREISRSEKQSRPRWEVLVAAGSGATVAQMARKMGAARQSVQPVADALAEAGLVRFEPNPNHRRSPMVRVTEEGARLRERLERKHRGWEQSVEGLVEPEDLETALVVLQAIRSTLER